MMVGGVCGSSVKHLLSQHEALNTSTNTTKKKLGKKRKKERKKTYVE
jgi:hypothetical protein